jgi:hypothetical protein
MFDMDTGQVSEWKNSRDTRDAFCCLCQLQDKDLSKARSRSRDAARHLLDAHKDFWASVSGRTLQQFWEYFMELRHRKGFKTWEWHEVKEHFSSGQSSALMGVKWSSGWIYSSFLWQKCL